ncbi:MAG: hypothetical protein ACI8YQ_004005 [Polaribacter sp.]
MKKATSILLAVFFLIGSLTPKMDFQQLLHLACAVEHYAEHQEDARDSGTIFTFADFLMDHYLDPANAVHEPESEHQHPCSHSHNHTIDYAEIDHPSTVPLAVETNGMAHRFSIIPLLYSADFTSGLEEPPSLS